MKPLIHNKKSMKQQRLFDLCVESFNHSVDSILDYFIKFLLNDLELIRQLMTAAMADPPNHFFKFIPPGVNFNISIPKSFLLSLDGWRSKKAILRRGCHKWPVDITDGGFFGDDWRKFVVDNGVQELDFIVFKHHGNMMFDFFVFDPSTCERQYPNLLDEVEDSLQDSLPESDSLHTHKRSEMFNKRKRTEYSFQSKDGLRLNDDHCFTTIMTPFSVQTSRITVPMKFARSNRLTTRRMHTQVVLVDEAKSTWPATLHIKTDQIRIAGWRNLIIANDVRVGDKCMFELVKAGEVPVFNLCNLAKKPTNNHIQVKKETSSSTCYYISSLKPYSCEKWHLYIQAEFSRSNGLRAGEMILIDDNGRSWKVQLNKLGENRLYIGRGFRDFVIGNGLREGDAYKFELLENEKDKPPVVNFSFLGKKAIKDHVQLQETSSKIKVTGSTLVKKENDKPPVVKGDWFNSCDKTDC
ncbi:B3 domain-containing protein REM5-like [Bidens hawaiensis]|uniref:B3 domain-containing protein REM5-like n=1 Tax=Bidens hawaiensis TaxID=980011 RepID=UPI0040499DA0